MHTPSQNEERKTKSRKVLFCSLALIALLVYLRWPRLHENMAYFASSLPNRNTLEREYRMEKPFQLVFKHGKRKIEQKKQDGSWISGTWDNSNERTLPPIKSSYDFIRGEHYVRTTLSAGKLLTITGSDGQSIEVQPITVSNATKVKWDSYTSGHIAEGSIDDVAFISGNFLDGEYLTVQAEFQKAK